MAVLVYSTPNCPYCKMAKDYLKGRGVEFGEIDVSKDVEKAAELMERSGQLGVPVIDVEGEIIIGFDRAAIDSALEKKGISRGDARGYG